MIAKPQRHTTPTWRNDIGPSVQQCQDRIMKADFPHQSLLLETGAPAIRRFDCGPSCPSLLATFRENNEPLAVSRGYAVGSRMSAPGAHVGAKLGCAIVW